MSHPFQSDTHVSQLSSASQRSAQVRNTLIEVTWPVLVYIVASFATKAYFMGDTRDYADSIAARAIGRDYYFWEFGHILWRPLGYVVFRICQPLTAYFVGADVLIQATLVLLVLSWLSGLVSVLLVHSFLSRVCRNRWVVHASIITFVFSLSFLNYFHSGTPYIPGLSLIVLALFLSNSVRHDEAVIVGRSVAAAFALAGAVLIWFPYVVVTPAVVLSPGFLFGFKKRRLVLASQTLMIAGALTIAVYAAVAWHIGVHSPTEFKAWLTVTSGGSGSAANSGITKTIFGFARAFVSMGNDGILFKRYLLHDPFNAVSFFDLVRLSLWKLLAFYLFLLAVALSLLGFPRGRRVLALLAVAGIPVIAFAIYWQGGDPERYLPLLPFLVLAVGLTLDERPRFRLRQVILIFVIGAAGINLFALATPRINRQQELSAARVTALLPNLKSNSVVVTANWQDELVNFNRTFPFNPINRNDNLHIGSLITPGRSDAASWRYDFSKGAKSVWEKGGDVWLSKRLFAKRPQPAWNWVEGDTPGVSWTDLYTFSSQLDVASSIGDEDGFVLLLPSEHNKGTLGQTGPQAKN